MAEEGAPDKPPEASIDIMAIFAQHQLDYKNAIEERDIIKALKVADDTLVTSLAVHNYSAFDGMARSIQMSIRFIMKYETLIYQHEARLLSDTTLFYICEFIKEFSHFRGFPLTRTFITPHRRRQLEKTLHAEPCLFTIPCRVNECESYAPNVADGYVEIFRDLIMPPVYEMSASRRHVVFWCHDGRFFGRGLVENMMLAPQIDECFSVPQQLDFYPLRDEETITGFRAFDFGTLFETDLRHYFVGDYRRSVKVLKFYNNLDFDPVCGTEPTNFWVTQARPKRSIMAPQVEDPRSFVVLTFRGSSAVIRIFPGYWITATPPLSNQRPILYLLDGVEKRDVRIGIYRCGRGKTWAVHDGALYCGEMTLQMMEENDGDERNLDNYVLFVDLREFRTPSPFQVTGLAYSHDTIYVKCGDYPCVSFDHMKYWEDNYRGFVHKFMFAAVEEWIRRKKEDGVEDPVEYYQESLEDVQEPRTIEYREVFPDSSPECSDYEDYEYEDEAEEEEEERQLFSVPPPLMGPLDPYPPVLSQLLGKAKAVRECGISTEPLKFDGYGRLLKKYRYANYLNFFAYIVAPRLPCNAPRFLTNYNDSIIEWEDAATVAKKRVKALFAEFERINHPGTDLWKPQRFLKLHPPPEDDTTDYGEYRLLVMVWSLVSFTGQLKLAWHLRRNVCGFDDPINIEVMKYLTQVLQFVRDHYESGRESGLLAGFDRPMLEFLDEQDQRVPDTQQLFLTMNPSAILDIRIGQGVLDESFRDNLDVKMVFRLQHRDPKVLDSLYEMRTSRLIIAAQNSCFLQFIDENGVLDLNKAYPDDPMLHRLIVQTHFVGHGLTDLEGCERHARAGVFDRLGWTLVKAQRFIRRCEVRYRGYLFATENGLRNSPNPLVGISGDCDDARAVYSLDGTVLYVHRLLRAIYSTIPADNPMADDNLPADWLLAAWRGLYDRKILEILSVEARTRIAHYYYTNGMIEAFHDLLKQIIIDSTSKDFMSVRFILYCFPRSAQQIVAEHRPGIILWEKLPPDVNHVKMITDMWPKNEFDRATRVPRKMYVDNRRVEKSVFHMIGLRNLKNYYTSVQERLSPMFKQFYACIQKDFPVADRPYRPNTPPDSRFADQELEASSSAPGPSNAGPRRAASEGSVEIPENPENWEAGAEAEVKVEAAGAGGSNGSTCSTGSFGPTQTPPVERKSSSGTSISSRATYATSSDGSGPSGAAPAAPTQQQKPKTKQFQKKQKKQKKGRKRF
ncbi:unnamed protein product [Caenorhabditis sp. 36 PRJEB53466]|nr:unnamed protein product [Caenorhabditis sp. 36 PRJEB53466]